MKKIFRNAKGLFSRNQSPKQILLAFILFSLLIISHTRGSALNIEQQESWRHADYGIIPQQSRSGPSPSPAVILRDNQKTIDEIKINGTEVLLPVPAYLWRHGCGPTALGMVVGFYDTQGYSDLVPGSAWMQTDAVNQMIASGGYRDYPMPPGSEGNYEDFASPEDQFPNMKTDAYITAGRIPHIDNSLADFMDTSKSTRDNYYGWSWSNDMGPSFINYISIINPAYIASYQSYYYYYSPRITWSVLTNEIDAGRPLVFLVDTDGNGGTDHFVTIIGYRTEPTLQYAAWDTWSNTVVRWENFSYIAFGVPWGIWGGWSFTLMGLEQPGSYLYLPIVRK